MPIRVITTGGTLDKEYDEATGQLVLRRTHVPDMLKLARSGLNVKITEMMLTDSVRMTNSSRESILDCCKDCKEDRIVIVHGTDSMMRTAGLLAESIKDKTIVLTGALVPYLFDRSDALFNLGSALAFVQTLPYGVYISLHGRYFDWNNVRKNRETGQFEEKRGETGMK